MPSKDQIHQIIQLGDREFDRLGGFIMSQYGIKMPGFKKTFLQSRLQKRLKELGLSSFQEYTDYLFSLQGQHEEIPHLVDAVSTNTTDFFRERNHFDFLSSEGLDDHVIRSGRHNLSIWSAGCASGEEPYSLAMLLKEYGSYHSIGFGITATDISDSVLQHAILGIYNMDKIHSIPVAYHKKYLLKGTDAYANKFRISQEVRNKVNFMKFNLIERDYRGVGHHDFIFCRNVLIYFEKAVQYRILKQLCGQILPGGYLFLGHSESIMSMDLPLWQIKPTIYMKTEESSTRAYLNDPTFYRML
jgi:chemotaxis protein methyltransferase CheR